MQGCIELYSLAGRTRAHLAVPDVDTKWAACGVATIPRRLHRLVGIRKGTGPRHDCRCSGNRYDVLGLEACMSQCTSPLGPASAGLFSSNGHERNVPTC